MAEIVVGVSGASGVVLAHRAIDVLTQMNHTVHLILSKAALYTAIEEMGAEYGTSQKFLRSFSAKQQDLITLHNNADFGSPLASGSFPTDGMLVIPCSMATLAAIAIGLSDNVLRRAADVHLKERRPLVVVPREMPFGENHLENMLRIARMGGIIAPPVPGWYTKPANLQEMEDFIIGRILDGLKIDAGLYPRWGCKSDE